MQGLTITASAVQLAEQAQGPSTTLDWIWIGIITTVVGGLALAFIRATSRRGASAFKRKRDHHSARTASKQVEKVQRLERIATDTADQTAHAQASEKHQSDQEHLAELHAAGGQRVVRHERHPHAPGATVAHFSDETYAIYFNGNMTRYKAFLQNYPGEARRSHLYRAPPVGKEFRPTQSPEGA